MTAVTLNSNDQNVAGWIRPYIDRMVAGDYTVLCLFYSGNGFKFDQAAAESLNGKPLVVLDMRELGWSHSHDDVDVMGWRHLDLQLDLYPEREEYNKLDRWIVSQKVVAYFKREFSKTLNRLIDGYQPFPIHPIDLLSFNRGPVPTPHREEFLARKGGIFFNYGNSHPDRLALHGALQTVRNSASNSIGVAQRVLAAGDETDLLEQVHFAARYPLEVVIGMQGAFKVSIALGGACTKTFRSSEVVNAVPVINDVGMRYAVEWNEGNAIMLPTENGRLQIPESIAIIEHLLGSQDTLWRIMQGAHEAAKELEPNTYMEKRVNKFIREAL